MLREMENIMAELKDLTTNLVMVEMTKQEPGWETRWADAQDLRDAMLKPPGEQQRFLQNRAQGKVMLAVRAAYMLTKKGG